MRALYMQSEQGENAKGWNSAATCDLLCNHTQRTGILHSTMHYVYIVFPCRLPKGEVVQESNCTCSFFSICGRILRTSSRHLLQMT